MTQHTDDTFTDLFHGIDLGVEPPMGSTAHDIARLGRRRVVRRRVAGSVTGAVGVVAVAAATAVLSPGSGLDVGELGRDAPVMAPPSPLPVEEAPSPFAEARLALFDAAHEHLDLEGGHLPAELGDPELGQSGGLDGGAVSSAGSKLDWIVPGEDGLGEVRVAVTTAGYAEAEEYALEGFASDFQCEIGADTCIERTLPDTDLRVWVAEDTGDLELAVILERADGSLVGVSADKLFSNNSIVPVSEVAITLEQAFAFVSDPDIVLDATPADMDDLQDSFDHVPGEEAEGASAEPVE